MKKTLLTSLLLCGTLLSLSASAAGPSRDDRAPNRDLPASLQGSEPDGELRTDAKGRFVPDAGALRLFDYFLTALGEETLPQVKARITAEINRHLRGEARGDANQLLEQYLDYRDEARQMNEGRTQPAELETGFAQLSDLRRKVFGRHTADLLFGEEEKLAGRFLEARRNPGDPDVQAARLSDESTVPMVLSQNEAGLKGRGATQAEIRSIRIEMVGVDAARRLEVLDREEAEFKSRLATYRQARKEIESTPGLSDEARAESIQRVLGQTFSTAEQVRVRALDRIEGVTPEVY
jgi:lipase chaperone LimK